MAIIAAGAGREIELAPRCVNAASISNAQATAGASQAKANRASLGSGSPPKSARLSPAEGRRGFQHCNCVSNRFVVFMLSSFQ